VTSKLISKQRNDQILYYLRPQSGSTDQVCIERVTSYTDDLTAKTLLSTVIILSPALF